MVHAFVQSAALPLSTAASFQLGLQRIEPQLDRVDEGAPERIVNVTTPAERKRIIMLPTSRA
jgi:hypothetical protein